MGMPNKLKNLKELVLNNCSRNFEYDTNNDLYIHEKLIKLIIRDVDDMNVSQTLKNIHLIFPNLEILEFNHNPDNEEGDLDTDSIINITHMKNLKKLRINFNGESSEKFLSSLIVNEIKLENLTLIDTKRTRALMDLITKLKTLKAIKISEMKTLNSRDLLELILKLPLLNKISIHRTKLKLNEKYVNKLGECLHSDFRLKLRDTGRSLINLKREKLIEKLIETNIKLTLMDFENTLHIRYDYDSENILDIDPYNYILNGLGDLPDTKNLKIICSSNPYTNPLIYSIYDISK